MPGAVVLAVRGQLAAQLDHDHPQLRHRAGQVVHALRRRLPDSGSYTSRGEVVPSSAESYDERREEELWAVADELCGLATATDATRRPARPRGGLPAES